LTRYVDDGRLKIDNNVCENAIRPTALGKKHFLFIGHPEAGQRSAVIYSVLGSCRRLSINPAEYLQDLFERLPKAKTSEVKSLTPAAWLKAKRDSRRQPTKS
jgi:transposase